MMQRIHYSTIPAVRKLKNMVTCTTPRNSTPQLPSPTRERDRGPDLEAAWRGSSSGGPQGEQQGELQLREKLGERDRQERRRISLY